MKSNDYILRQKEWLKTNGYKIGDRFQIINNLKGHSKYVEDIAVNASDGIGDIVYLKRITNNYLILKDSKNEYEYFCYYFNLVRDYDTEEKNMSKNLTKQQLMDLVKKTLEFADGEGMLDDLCENGQNLINKLRCAVDMEVEIPRLDFFITTENFNSKFSDYLNDLNYEVVIKYHGEEVPIDSITIEKNW